jgi:hypothetical protein
MGKRQIKLTAEQEATPGSDLKKLKRVAQVLGFTIKKSRRKYSGYSLIVDEDGSRPLGNEASLEEIEKHLANCAGDLGIDDDDIEFSEAIRRKGTDVKEKTLEYLRANGVDPAEFSQWSDRREIAMGDRGMEAPRFDRVIDHQTHVVEFGRPPHAAPKVSDESGGGTGLKNESSRARRNKSLIFGLRPQTAKQWAAFIRRVKRYRKSRNVDDLLPPPAERKVGADLKHGQREIAPLTVKHDNDYWAQRRGHGPWPENWHNLAAESPPPPPEEEPELGADWTPQHRIEWNARERGKAARRAARRERLEQERDRAIVSKVVADDLAGVAGRNELLTRLISDDIATGPDHFTDETGLTHEFIRPSREHDPQPKPSIGFAREKRSISRFGTQRRRRRHR